MEDVEVYVMFILLNEMYVGTRINLIPIVLVDTELSKTGVKRSWTSSISLTDEFVMQN